MIRVGFVFSFDDGWLGGINYFRNLLTALYEFPNRQIEAVIFTGTHTPARHFEGFPAVKIVHSRLFDRGTLSWLIRKLWLRFFVHDLLLERLLKEHEVDVLSHSGWLGKGALIPTIGWIPDFQHIHLPEFFSNQEISQRNNCYHSLCRYCTLVFVSSYNAQNDLYHFSPEYTEKYEVLQFVATARDETTPLQNIENIEERYEFSGKYFLLPNQFWVHKNHGLVIEALGLLGRENKKVVVLSTGATTDYRHPGYFGELMDRVKELEIQDCFRVLGVVPADDLAVLMQHSIALINPSRFEGWSTIVEEAKSLGKKILLSDIAVHREQNPSFATYFSTDDANALAIALWDTWNKPAQNGIQMEVFSRLETDKKRLEFAHKYQKIVLKTVAGKYVDEQQIE